MRFFRFFLKSLFLLFFCLLVFLAVQRKNIADRVIRSQLNKLAVHDLSFKVAELSPFTFELQDIRWGEQQAPFFYLSSIKVQYTPKGLYGGVVDKVVAGRLETSLLFNNENKPQSELIERVLQVVARAQQVYPAGADEAGGAKGPLVLPEFVLERGTLNLHGTGSFPMEERVVFDLQLRQGVGAINLRSRLNLPGVGTPVLRGRVEIPTLDLSSAITARITASADLSTLTALPSGFEPAQADLTGEFTVAGLSAGAPEWSLKLRLPSHPCAVTNDTVQLSGTLQGIGEFSGAGPRLSGGASLTLSNLVSKIKSSAGDTLLATRAQRINLSFELPEAAPDRVEDILLSGCVGVEELLCNAPGDLLTLKQGTLNIPFTFSEPQGWEFEKSRLEWALCRVGGVEFEAGKLQLSISNSYAQVASWVTVKDEALKVAVECELPLLKPQAGTLRLDVLPAVVESSGKLGKLVRKKSGLKLDFAGELSAAVRVAGLSSDAVITGMVRLVNGSCSYQEVTLGGLAAHMPFKFDGALRSTGEALLTVESVRAGNIAMGPGKVFFQLREDELFIERAQMAWAKGFLHAYAIHAGLDGGIRNEFVIYADKMDLGEVFMLVMPFDGRMEGVLYGRFPVVLKKNRVELSGGYLYSLPNQGGVLKLNNPAQMESLLNRAGITDDREKSLSKALSDLDLSAIRLDLEPRLDGDSSLRIKLDGKSNYQKRPAPVSLNLNLNGQLQQLLDLGMDMSQ